MLVPLFHFTGFFSTFTKSLRFILPKIKYHHHQYHDVYGYSSISFTVKLQARQGHYYHLPPSISSSDPTRFDRKPSNGRSNLYGCSDLSVRPLEPATRPRPMMAKGTKCDFMLTWSTASHLITDRFWIWCLYATSHYLTDFVYSSGERTP